MNITPEVINALESLRSIVQVSRSGAAQYVKILDRAGVFAEIDKAREAASVGGFDVDLAYKVYRDDGTQLPARTKQFDNVDAPDEETALLAAQSLLINMLVKAGLARSAVDVEIISGVTAPAS